MKKIISLFQRNYEGDHLVRNEVVSGAEWVLAGEGTATQKLDGTCCMIVNGKLYKRYDAKKNKTPPIGFIPCQDPDLITGHWPGWILVNHDNPSDRWHVEAFSNLKFTDDWTYELIGEKINGNPEHIVGHSLEPHGFRVFDPQPPHNFEGIKKFLEERNVEGIVWHHEDGRMVKIKKKDFGLRRIPE